MSCLGQPASSLHSLHTRKIWKRSLEKYKNCRTVSKTTHERGVFQQRTEAEAVVVQDGLSKSREKIVNIDLHQTENCVS